MAAATLNKAGFCSTLGKLCLVLWQIPLTVFLQSATSMPDTKGPYSGHNHRKAQRFPGPSRIPGFARIPETFGTFELQGSDVDALQKNTLK